MSISSVDPNVRWQKTIPFGRQEPEKNKSDPLYISKRIKNWDVVLTLNEYSKIKMSASRTIGRLGSNQPADEAKIDFSVETTENRVPVVKLIGSLYDAQFIEIDDRLDRTTESFKNNKGYYTDETYKREWYASSVLTTEEFLHEIFPKFEELLQDKKLDEYVSKFTEDASKVQKPHNKNYVIEKWVA